MVAMKNDYNGGRGYETLLSNEDKGMVMKKNIFLIKPAFPILFMSIFTETMFDFLVSHDMNVNSLTGCNAFNTV